MATQYETQTKTYKHQDDFNKDAERMLKRGWTYNPDMVRDGKREGDSKVYRSSKAYEQDAQRRIRDGWEVHDSVTNQPRSGCMRILLTGGLGAFLFKPKPEITVSYVRAEKIVTWTRPKS